MSQNLSSAYKEKKWGKDVEGEHVIDGFVFRGKVRFKKALEGLKSVMIKGASAEYRGVKYTVLDARKKGAGIEAEVAVETKKVGERGVAVLEMMGPNNRKEFVVMITKSKSSESKFVVILTEKILKPMMLDFMMDVDVQNQIKREKTAKRQESQIKCSHCDKIFKTNPGLKTHIKRKHRDDEITSNDESRDTLKNTENQLKTYQRKCEMCDFKTEASRKYVVAQNIIKHKEDVHKSLKKSQKIIKCNECDFVARDSMVMKRHIRDEHGTGSISISPPPKKKRKTPVENINGEEMEVVEDSIEDLSFKVEDMEIDNHEEKGELEERSNIMDMKIKRKQEQIERQETLVKEKQMETDEKILLNEENKIRSEKEQKKKRKQKSKDERKRKNTKSRKIESLNENRIKNLKNIPEEVKNLVEEDDVVYVVPGDGCCAQNCTAAWLFHDEKYGPQLRRKINSFLVKHWDKRYQYITNCSLETPFKRKLKGKTISFTDPKKLLSFLETSADAAFMWSDCEDLAIIADIYQMKIKVITINRADNIPTVNWVYPDPDLREFADLKDANIDEMVLLHEEESHFNLIISKNSDLAKLGNISSRIVEEVIEGETGNNKEKLVTIQELQKQLKQCKDSKEKVDIKYLNCERELRLKTEELEQIKIEISNLKQLEELKNQQKEVNNDNDGMEEAEALIRMKNSGFQRRSPQEESTPIIDKLRSVKRVEEEFNCNECDFQGTEKHQLAKHINLKHEAVKCSMCNFIGGGKVELEKHTKIEHSGSDNKIGNCSQEKHEELLVHTKSNSKQYDCYECDFEVGSKEQLKQHLKNIHGIGQEFKCSKCEYVGGTQIILEKHVELIHTKKKPVNCYDCEEKMETKADLKTHMKDKHGMVQLSGTVMTSVNIECRICHKSFQDKRNFMHHRKSMHAEVVAFCKNDIEGKCIFSNIKCWWKHKENIEEEKFTIACFICQKTFPGKDLMMMHRKNDHSNFVKLCDKLENDECKFGSNECWFKHKDEQVEEEKEKRNEESVFHNAMETNQVK